MGLLDESAAKAGAVHLPCPEALSSKSVVLYQLSALCCLCRLRPMATAAVPGPLTRCDVAVADALCLPYRSGAELSATQHIFMSTGLTNQCPFKVLGADSSQRSQCGASTIACTL